MPGFPFKSRDIVNYSALLSNPWPYVLLARHNPPSRSLRWLSLTIVLGTQFNEGKKRKEEEEEDTYLPLPTIHWEGAVAVESASEKQSLKAS